MPYESHTQQDLAANFVRISCPLSGDKLCDTVVAAGTYNGVAAVSVTFAGQTKAADLSGGTWKATFTGVGHGTYTLTASASGVSNATQPNIIVIDDPCAMVVTQPVHGSTYAGGTIPVSAAYDTSRGTSVSVGVIRPDLTTVPCMVATTISIPGTYSTNITGVEPGSDYRVVITLSGFSGVVHIITTGPLRVTA